MRRAVAAYRYDVGTNPPAYLAHLAVVEVPEGTVVPAGLAHWDVTYYNPGEAPANQKPFGAWAYSLADALPARLKAVAAWVAVIIGELFGHGHLDFSHDVDSHHVATVL